jgi:U3 small nucleolar RNA-associated protein 19
MVVRALLAPQPSQRGAVKGKIVPENQEGEGELPGDIVDKVGEEYWAAYDDLRLFFFREVAALVAADEVEQDAVMAQLAPLTNLPKKQEDINAFFVPGLENAPAEKEEGTSKKAKTKKGKKGKKELDSLPEWMETYDSASEGEEEVGGKRKRTSALGTAAAVHSVAAHTNAYTSAWEATLSRPLSEGWTRRVLAGLHGERGVLSHWAPARRVRLADWLGGTVDEGGAHALLAMNGLFVLMTQYNLDYPRFYERLYALLDGEVLHARYRARFFRLLDTFLRSPMLGAALVAAFIKRLARLALAAPPAGAILVIPFVYNLFKRHPGTMPMLHRLPDEMEGDPYDENEPVPGKSKAIDSSVWELAALKNHYLASVGTMAKIFGEQFTKPEFNLEDFLDHGYGTVSCRHMADALTPALRDRNEAPHQERARAQRAARVGAAGRHRATVPNRRAGGRARCSERALGVLGGGRPGRMRRGR